MAPQWPEVEVVQDRVLDWFAAQARDFPWRRTRDPYAILVSEVMLQQTQASRVVPHFQRFLGRFPTIGVLAAADTADVITAWRGLGYNRRALALQRAARAVVAEHGGRLPADVDALRRLPGIGEYTARAVAVYAFGLPVAPVDVNIGRVLQRAAVGRPRTRRDLQQLADDAVPVGRAVAWSSALMDLGATICTARSPRCAECPIATSCAWRSRGGDDPAARPDRRPQRPFRQTDRFHRGRLVDALRGGPVPRHDLAEAARLADGPRLDEIVNGLVQDGLAEWSRGVLHLPT